MNGPDLLNSCTKVHLLLQALLKHRLCQGNRDPKFDVLSQSRKGVFRDTKGKYYNCYFYTIKISCVYPILTGEVVIANVEKEVLWEDTIRHADCDILLSPDNNTEWCSSCGAHRNSLRAMLSKQQHAHGGSDRSAPESSVNFRYMHNFDNLVLALIVLLPYFF